MWFFNYQFNFNIDLVCSICMKLLPIYINQIKDRKLKLNIEKEIWTLKSASIAVILVLLIFFNIFIWILFLFTLFLLLNPLTFFILKLHASSIAEFFTALITNLQFPIVDLFPRNIDQILHYLGIDLPHPTQIVAGQADNSIWIFSSLPCSLPSFLLPCPKCQPV